MADYRKHRLEARAFAFDFKNYLATGDSLTGTPTVKVLQESSGSWVDKSSEFGALSPAIDGTKVTWTLGAATGTDQDGGDYRVLVEADTADGEHLVGAVKVRENFQRPTLRVTEDADEDAP